LTDGEKFKVSAPASIKVRGKVTFWASRAGLGGSRRCPELPFLSPWHGWSLWRRLLSWSFGAERGVSLCSTSVAIFYS